MRSTSSPSGKPRSVKQRASSASSRTDRARLHDADRPGVPSSDHPEADVAHVVRGIVRQGLKPLPAKALVSLRVDQDVLDWFKAQGPGYQTRINAVLKAFRDASS
ncbi:MAG: BrnA antitoxin family protein [Rhodocyclaceae bacterium]|nr:BrnA antitoxin family protein [Rhodocyclaceae bacterium]MCA3644134.1 BrnA antitoxin family protein [Methylobacterium sp.]MCA3075515.1 BrnA antitoxin family protein [Rhodocyclaceae bacterium]MCA3100202.1 BrnA antitoxin family protein [Rhodocyclaceae bacterium]MCA3104178.1 BrnA antitoxin family protein [Rhodocyclaceae bacterium]